MRNSVRPTRNWSTLMLSARDEDVVLSHDLPNRTQAPYRAVIVKGATGGVNWLFSMHRGRAQELSCLLK